MLQACCRLIAAYESYRKQRKRSGVAISDANRKVSQDDRGVSVFMREIPIFTVKLT